MLCPVCKTQELVMTERKGVEIDYCPACRGVWLDRGELDKIIERTLQTDVAGAPENAPNPGPQPGWPQYGGHRDERHHGHRDDHHGGYGQHGQRRSFWKDLFD